MTLSNYVKSKSIPLKTVQIKDAFWNERLKMNNSLAIFYQWDQLEETHNQDNFRILAGTKEGYRLGFFYCDSDLHKWADAAARILTTNVNNKLSGLIQEYIDLIQSVQEPDGYLYTYNQFHFPNRRWANIQIEHELYCLGHMIEAAVSYMETNEPDTYKQKLLGVATKAADLLVNDFQNAKSKYTPGHQEIEIALIRLYQLTSQKKYLDLAAHLLYKRGKIPFFGIGIIKQVIDQNKRQKHIVKDMQNKNVVNETSINFFGGETKHQKEVHLLDLRSFFQYLTGRYQQQNAPIHKMKRPYGHSVRWGYLATAMAMLYQETGDSKILKALEITWNHLVRKQMFITGGIGSLGTVEGFGRDYELNSKYCYCETCAAIANIMLNWELALITNEAKYSDLLEWQFYNAMSVGIGLKGNSYLYQNLLESDGQLVRKYWFATPCCPSNISRIWASFGEFIYSFDSKNIWIHQFVGNSTEIFLSNGNYRVKLQMNSELPWKGKVKLTVQVADPQEFTINVRIPSWTDNPKIKINNKNLPLQNTKLQTMQTGSGFSPYNSMFQPITKIWEKETVIEIDFPMSINIHRAHPKVKSNRNKIALSKGPIVYCFETPDNPLIQIPNATIDLTKELTYKFDKKLFGGVNKLITEDKLGQKLTAIPYFCWANREPSSMQVWINE
ncbi:MAG: glycoside hydrolase family 127 protein [Candidatus Heimdallarchaeota archaeon]